MKKFTSIIHNILAILGVLSILAVIAYFVASPYFEINVEKSRLARYSDYVDSLRTSGRYVEDTTDFQITIIQDSNRAKEILAYFKLDTLYLSDSDTWTKAIAIGKFVASNIPHANQKEWPDSINAVGLWEYTRNVAPAFNCRLHSILTFELLLAAGIDAKYITCMPEDENDKDCHVVNEVWLPELGKWAMIDTDMGGHYVTDMTGMPLSLREMREHYISGEKMIMHPAFGKGRTKKDEYYSYMAKNTYWFSCWGELSYYQEDYNIEDVVRNHYINLIPSGYKPYRIGGGNTVTTDADKFWAPPTE